MDLYTNSGNIRLGNCKRFTSLTMYNLHIFYLAPLMFSRSSHFLISGLYAGNTKIKGQPHWVVLLDLCQLFPSMHDYCFLPCIWPQVIDSFPSKQTGIVGMAVSFSIARGMAWLEGRSLAWSLPIVSFHAWLLFPFMHVALGDRFVSFKVGGDRRDGSFFFYRAGYRMARREERPQKKSHKKIVLLLVFLVVGDN